MKHSYKGFTIEKDGTREFPWNIYRDKHIPYQDDHVGFDRTIKCCKAAIDAGCFDIADRTGATSKEEQP